MEIKNLSAYDKRKKRLFKNWYYLTILQIAQYVVPFIPIPYLVRVLSLDKFGLVAFAVAISQFFAVFVEYGFSYSSVKRIAINKSDNDKITEIYSATIIIKALIFTVMAAIFVPIVLFVPQISGEKLVFIYAFLMVFSDIFFTTWFFQGMERMRYIAYLNLVMEILFVVLIFIFVREEKDYYLVPLLNSLCSLLIGLISIRIIYKVFGVKFKF
ncbi:MAG: oligosaccharide flippase family protein, partial [Endomicrobia bacterium]|nr:oligosaccharide flippase family protein [Endomicrobiia bacterium]